MKTREEELTLVADALAGSQAAYTDLYNYLFPIVRRRIYTIAVRGFLDEITHDATTRALIQLQRYGGVNAAKPSTWALNVAKNYALDYLRNSRHEWQDTKLSVDQVIHSDTCSSRDKILAKVMIDSVFNQLHPRYQKVLKMDMDGFSGRSIADEFGMTEGAARTLLFRGKAELRELLV